ncbi:hypothetical protein M404DRAFT_1005719 [Pisolithus tinctorius Marx 270]|uniref:Uncharacterized protein n=1 Tax=Pisolithus tinctorius Marx 270 TaxID=870435 RepID=A0A0C3NRU8_PISTI|nr:hypothetical protein M404DRAFT_1005719 [Pisolithus tinctorius Marx 270]
MFQSRESTQSRDRCKSVVSAKHVLQVVNPQIQARVLLPWTEFLANILPVLTTHHHQNQVSADLLSISCGPSIMSLWRPRKIGLMPCSVHKHSGNVPYVITSLPSSPLLRRAKRQH